MSATNFKTENNTYRKMIGNGLTYRIRRFQRDYSWTEVEWEDLWADIVRHDCGKWRAGSLAKIATSVWRIAQLS